MTKKAIKKPKRYTLLKINNMVNIPTEKNEIQLNKDQEAVRAYFLENINPNTVFFHTLEEKIDYLIENDYIEETFIQKYDFSFIKELFQFIYDQKFRLNYFIFVYIFFIQYSIMNNKVFLQKLEKKCK